MSRRPVAGDLVRLLWIDTHSCLREGFQPSYSQVGQTFIVLEVEDLSDVDLKHPGPYLLTCLQCDNFQKHHLYHYEVETITEK